MTLALSLDQLAGSEVSLIGGKAAALGRIYKSGVKAPYTICLTTQACRTFVAATGVRLKIRMRESLSHDECNGVLVEKMRSGIHRCIELTFGIRSSNHAVTLSIVKVVAKIHDLTP